MTRPETEELLRHTDELDARLLRGPISDADMIAYTALLPKLAAAVRALNDERPEPVDHDELLSLCTRAESHVRCMAPHIAARASTTLTVSLIAGVRGLLAEVDRLRAAAPQPPTVERSTVYLAVRRTMATSIGDNKPLAVDITDAVIAAAQNPEAT